MTSEQRARIAGVFDRAAPTYDELGVAYFGPIGRQLAADAALRPGEHVLDIGCGRGAVLFPAAEAVGPGGQVTGIDLAPGMVEATNAEIRGRGLATAEAVVMDAQEPTLAAASYDVVLSSLALFFLTDPPTALARYRDSLRGGGRLAFTTFGGEDPRWAWMEQMRATFLPGEQLRPPGRAAFESDASISALLEDAGFVDVRSVTRLLEVRFRDVGQWWEWTWSQGNRVYWEQLDEDSVAHARRRCEEHIAAYTAADGSVPLSQPVRYTTAFKR